MATAGGLPKYMQISERLIRQIAAGHLADGARLPPERDMAAETGISVGTLRKALADLEEKGLLERIQGSGNYVRHKADVPSVYAMFRLELAGGGGLPTAEVLDVARLAKPSEAPGFGPDPEGHRIRRLRRLDGIAIAAEEIWLDGARAGRIDARTLPDSLYRYYREALGFEVGWAEDRVGLRALPGWAPEEVGPPRPMGFIERLSRDRAGEPVEYSLTWFDTDKARYISRMGMGYPG